MLTETYIIYYNVLSCGLQWVSNNFSSDINRLLIVDLAHTLPLKVHKLWGCIDLLFVTTVDLTLSVRVHLISVVIVWRGQIYRVLYI